MERVTVARRDTSSVSVNRVGTLRMDLHGVLYIHSTSLARRVSTGLDPEGDKYSAITYL